MNLSISIGSTHDFKPVIYPKCCQDCYFKRHFFLCFQQCRLEFKILFSIVVIINFF